MRDYIVAEHLTKEFGGMPVVDHVSFVLPKGEITAIIGPNGAGKSTLARMMMGLLEPDKGTVTIHGQVPARVRTTIGYVPQRFSFNPFIPMTVGEFLLLSLHVCGKHDREDRNIVEARLDDVGVSAIFHKQLSELSGGQLQRMMIARALLTDKELLILDEPVAGVDIEGQQSIYELLFKMNKERGTTLILISHELDVVFRYAKQVLCINRKMLCQGKPKEAITEKIFQEMYGLSHHAHYHHD